MTMQDEFFAGYEASRHIFEILHDVMDTLGPVELSVGKSQIAFHQRIAFVWAWIPGKYLRGKPAPLVLTVALRRRDASPRWKEIVEPRPGRFTHHLELFSRQEIDQEVRAWLQEAWKLAG